MKKHEQSYTQYDSYETGSTKPPKDHGGIIAALLVALILVGGLCSALGFLNVRLLQLLQVQEDPSATLSVFDSDATQPTAGSPHYTAPEKVTLSLVAPPQNTPETPAEPRYSWLVRVACGENNGAGIVMAENGYIITRSHFLSDAPITVTFNNGMKLSATLVGIDENIHIAVLYVTATGLSPAQFGDPDYLQAGEELLLLGEETRNHTFDQDIPDVHLLQTAVVLNRYGQVVAIPTVCQEEIHCVMTDHLKPAVDRILEASLFRKGVLELTGQTVSIFDRRFYGLPQGVLVTQVEDGGSANIAGIRSGDVITALNDTAITSWKELQSDLSRLQAGETVKLQFYRPQGEQTFTVTAVLSEAEEEK
jgi:S1-C subfamily serine protease